MPLVNIKAGPTCFKEEDFQRFAFLSLKHAITTRVQFGIKSLAQETSLSTIFKIEDIFI